MDSQQSHPDATGADRPADARGTSGTLCGECGEAPCAIDCPAVPVTDEDRRTAAEKRRQAAEYRRALETARGRLGADVIQRDQDELAWALAAVEDGAFLRFDDLIVHLYAEKMRMLGRKLAGPECVRLRYTVDTVWARLQASRSECGSAAAVA